MRRRSLALGLVPALPLLAAGAFGACSREPARIGLVMRTPQGLLDGATSVALWVFPAKLAECGANGHVSTIPAGDASEQFRLERDACPPGVSWCRDITLAQDDAETLFAVVAADTGGTLAEGCTVTRIDQDPLEVTIKVQRFNPPSCCNDGVLQAGEQCDPGGSTSTGCAGEPGGACSGIAADAVCGCDCRSQEILLSIDDTGPPHLENGPPRSKSRLSMAFAPGSPKIAGALRAVYRNDSPSSTTKADIALRFLSKDLYPISDPVSLSEQLLLPFGCASVTQGGIVQTQDTPSISPIGLDLTGIAYASDQAIPNAFDIWLVVHSTDGCREECRITDEECIAHHTPVRLSQPSEAPGSSDPDLAGGPGGNALAVWSRGGRVLGRIWRAPGELVPSDGEIEIASAGQHARVAGGPTGWRVAYQGAGTGDAEGVFMTTLSVNGDVGAAARVNARTDGTQDQPDVAMLPDGRALVVWRSATDIYFQRYDPDGVAVAGDQEAPLNTTLDGEQASPAAAASTGLGDFFAVAWESPGTGAIAARFPHGDTGFLFNSVTGQNGDFVASDPALQGARRYPAVAIGGGGYVAIGWQDDSDAHPGIFVRRFPLPSTR